jgi:DNA-binding HxlR family transcriptional regulator
LDGWLESDSADRHRHERKETVKALIGGWDTNMVRALAPRPLSLTELDRALVGLDYPSLQRRLSAMHRVGLVRPLQSHNGGTPHAATVWLRRAVAPIVAAVHWEHRYLRGHAPPVTKHDVEAAFLLSVPLLKLPAELSGSCRLTVELADVEPSHAGVSIDVENGRVVSCVSRLQGDADAWATSPSIAELWAIIERDQAEIEIGGESGLASRILESLHHAVRAGREPNTT